jgi:hypothetical protein
MKTRHRRFRWILFSACLPGTLGISCTSALIRETRDGVISGARTFLEAATVELLNQLLGTGQDQ